MYCYRKDNVIMFSEFVIISAFISSISKSFDVIYDWRLFIELVVVVLSALSIREASTSDFV